MRTAERSEEGGQGYGGGEGCGMTDEEWVRCKGREFSPDRVSAGLSCREGGTVGGGRRMGASRGQSPDQLVGRKGDRF